MGNKDKRMKPHEPTIAPGLEMDELKVKASKEEIERGDSTSVTNLILDRTPED